MANYKHRADKPRFTGQNQQHFNVPTYAKACGDKHEYSSKNRADAAIRRILVDPRPVNTKHKNYELQPYKCKICDCWHIGHGRKKPNDNNQIIPGGYDDNGFAI